MINIFDTLYAANMPELDVLSMKSDVFEEEEKE